ncbi:hypothetical protein HY637_02425 [Candidatus Woesearchaeota archaeon]|nr:hypothetical protein [Candidatus Woesearchaeota archaeon]
MIAAIISILLFSACNPAETQKTLTREIDTGKGELTLKYENSQAVLSGELFRGTPCVSWKVDVITTKDLPISQVNINIYDENKNKDIVCIQVVAEPQEINKVIEGVSENTKYIINFEDKVVFDGKIGDKK